MNNIETVQKIYEAFGTQDMASILERMAEDVSWEYAYAPGDVPWLQPRKGRAGVGEFFQSLAGLNITKFDVKHISASGDTVVALIDLEATVQSSGGRISERDEAHVWKFDGRGRVAAFRHCVDTLQHQRALRGQ